MADTATFTLKLKDEASGASERVTDALEGLRKKLQEDTASLRIMQTALAAMKKGGLQATTEFKDLQAKITLQRKAVGESTRDILKLGGSFSRVAAVQRKAASDSTQDVHKMGESFNRVAETAEGVGLERIAEKGAEMFGELAKKVGEAALEFVHFAVESADAHRTLTLQLEALTGSKEAGDELVETINRIARTGLASTESLDGMARGLAAAGLSGEELSGALQNITTVGATVGGNAAEKVQALYQKIEAAGGKLKLSTKMLAGTGLEGVFTKQEKAALTVDKLSAGIARRFRGDLGPATLGLKAQSQALHANFEQLFEGLDLDPFLKGLRSIVDFFSQDTESGKALKDIVELMFGSIGNEATGALGAVRSLFENMLIWVLEAAIEYEKLRLKIRDALGLDVRKYGVDWNLVGEAVLVAAGAIAAIVGEVLVMTGAVLAAPVVLAALAIELYRLGAAALDAGTSFITGLVAGIKNGVGLVVDAVRGLAHSVIDTVKGVFQSHSPSLVMARIGGDVGEGMALGVEGKQDRVASAMGSIGAVPDVERGAATTGRGGVTLGPINVTIDASGAADPAALRAAVEEGLFVALDNAGALLGAQAGA